MSETKQTWQWVAAVNTSGEKVQDKSFLQTADHKIILMLARWFDVEESHAALISAAPDLLRALKDLREQVDAHVVVVGCSHFNTRLATEVIDRIEKP